jgi:hypothetical protein
MWREPKIPTSSQHLLPRHAVGHLGNGPCSPSQPSAICSPSQRETAITGRPPGTNHQALSLINSSLTDTITGAMVSYNRNTMERIKAEGAKGVIYMGKTIRPLCRQWAERSKIGHGQMAVKNGHRGTTNTYIKAF